MAFSVFWLLDRVPWSWAWWVWAFADTSSLTREDVSVVVSLFKHVFSGFARRSHMGSMQGVNREMGAQHQSTQV